MMRKKNSNKIDPSEKEEDATAVEFSSKFDKFLNGGK
jgi:hypothetical protein